MQLSGLYKKTLLAVVPLALASALIEPLRLPLGILAGGALGLFNLRGLKRGVENLLAVHAEAGTAPAPMGRLIFMSFFRLFLLGAIIALLAISRLVNLIGLLVGFTVVFTLLLFEGLRASREL